MPRIRDRFLFAALLGWIAGAGASAQCYQQRLADVPLDPQEGARFPPTVFNGQTAVIAPSSGVGVTIIEQVAGEWSRTQVLAGSDNELGDFFGEAMAITDSRLLVGAPQHENGGLRQSGAAYVFHRDSGQWVQAAKLVPSDPEDEAFFAEYVAIDGDRAVISARFGANGAQRRVYVFEYEGSAWTQTAMLISPNQATYDGFGGGLAVWGDMIVVAAGGDDDLGENAGALYVFELQAGQWEATEKVYPPGTAGFGDVGLTWASTHGVIACCPGFPTEYATYVFSFDGSSWSTAELPHAHPGDGAVFGAPYVRGDTMMVAGRGLFLEPISTVRYELVGGAWIPSETYMDLMVDAFADETAISVQWQSHYSAEVWDLCAPPCAADWDLDGSTDTRDILAFLNDWAAGEADADVNGDGVVDTQDVIEFLNIWSAGC